MSGHHKWPPNGYDRKPKPTTSEAQQECSSIADSKKIAHEVQASEALEQLFDKMASWRASGGPSEVEETLGVITTIRALFAAQQEELEQLVRHNAEITKFWRDWLDDFIRCCVCIVLEDDTLRTQIRKLPGGA